ncbi:hypothetical protein JOB18_039570 [Solea senegalensis]|uniref:Uncharacterized protein n=1 Tax=Solea senegalensis TaxID=28829 RepID=A0AAV6Q797_SOLSE|nr:hypothetical protein JOB18_039570 [Solea senegalensis]
MEAQSGLVASLSPAENHALATLTTVPVPVYQCVHTLLCTAGALVLSEDAAVRW